MALLIPLSALFIFCSVGFAQTNEAEAPKPALAGRPPAKTQTKKIESSKPAANPFAPPRTPQSLLPFSFLSMRFMQTKKENLNSGVILGQIGLNMPASSYLYSSYSFRSTAASTKGTTDLQAFSLNLLAYTPQIWGFGLAGNYLTSGASTNTYRLGPFFRYFLKTPTSAIIITPHILLNFASTDVGRFVTLWSTSFYGGFLITEGSLTHTWKNSPETKISTSTFDLAILFRIYQNIRFSISYGYSKDSTLDTSTNNTGIGIDLREVF